MVRVGSGSPLAGVALARLGIEVAYPDRSDVEGGLKSIASALVAFRNFVNRDARAAAQESLAEAQTRLDQLSDINSAHAIDRDNFELGQQRQFATKGAQVFAAANDRISALAKRAVLAPETIGITGKLAGHLTRGLKEQGEEWHNLSRAAKNYYLLLEDEQQQVMQLMDAHLAGQQSALVQLKREMEDAQRLVNQANDFLVQTGGQPSLDPASQKAAEIGKAQQDIVSARRKEIRLAEENIEVSKEAIKFYLGAQKATETGAKNRTAAMRAANNEVNEWLKKIKDADAATQKWANAIVGPIANAINSFKGALKESVMALTIFYYKINEATAALAGFQQELMNAQSIFQTSTETLFTLSDEIVKFGTEFGISYDEAAKGLYQFASAGLSAEDSLRLLNDTLKLSMAVQGDHNTIAKLTTQVIYGFGLTMDDATDVTDKFAHAINKSLIEYQDLASAIKFSMPFFVSSGQSLETLLGALQVLTNRALEAGIAGRGLRQALAEFTQHADDNAAGFRKLGVEILDVEGNMYDLTYIAQQFNDTLGEQASDMEIMMTLMEDLNIRGATAFVHLVQNADEFTAAVDDLANSSGAAAEMAAIQQEGLLMQIQRLKNLFMAPFLLSENMARDVGELNRLAIAMKMVIDSLSEIVIEGEGANATLTATGVYMKDVLIGAVLSFGDTLQKIVDVIQEWSEAGLLNVDMIKLYFLPTTILIKLLDLVGGNMGRVIFAVYILNKTLPILAFFTRAYAAAVWLAENATFVLWFRSTTWHQIGPGLILNNMKVALSFQHIAYSVGAIAVGLYAGVKIGKWMSDAWGPVITILIGVAIASAAVIAAWTLGKSAFSTMKGWTALLGAGLGMGIAISGISSATAPPEMQEFGELEAYMAQLETPTYAGSGGERESQDIYVKKLIYTDSNQSEYMQVQTSTQTGAGG